METRGLFATKETSDEATAGASILAPESNEEPRYSTTQFNSASKTVNAISDEPRYGNTRTEQLNEKPHYNTTFTKIPPREEEPHYSTSIRSALQPLHR